MEDVVRSQCVESSAFNISGLHTDLTLKSRYEPMSPSAQSFNFPFSQVESVIFKKEWLSVFLCPLPHPPCLWKKWHSSISSRGDLVLLYFGNRMRNSWV